MPFLCSLSQQIVMDSSDDEFEEVDVITFLQRAGEQYRRHVDLLREEARRKEKSEMRSKPVICPYERITDRDRGPVEERLHKLWAKKLESEAAMKNQHEERAKAAEGAECTFRPKVTAAAQKLPDRGSQGHISQEFLKKHREKIEKLRDEALRKEMEDVAIGSNRSRSATRSHGEEDHRHGLSVEDYLLMKEKERQRKLYEQAEAQAATGKPRISHRAQNLERPGDVVSRLYDPDYRPVVYDAEMIEHCTFHPRLHSDYDDPLENLPIYDRVIQRQVKHRSRIANEPRSPRGKPKISDVSQSIIKDLREKERESGEDASPGTRLYNQGTKKLKEKEVSRERDARNKFPYKPQLTEESKKLMRKKPEGSELDLYERWQRQEAEKKKRIAALRAEEEAEKLKECTFTPNSAVSPISAANKSHDFSGWMEKSTLWERNRRSRIQNSKIEAEESEMEQCTFQPLVHHEVPLPAAAKTATGFETHIRRMQEARQLEEQKLEQLQSGHSTPRKSRPTTPRRTLPFSTHRDPVPIESLRAPVNRYDVPEPLYDIPEPSDYLHPAERYEEYPRTQHPQRTPRNDRSQQRSSSRRSASTTQPSYPSAPISAPQPSPVDFILENHQAIVRGFRRT